MGGVCLLTYFSPEVGFGCQPDGLGPDRGDTPQRRLSHAALQRPEIGQGEAIFGAPPPARGFPATCARENPRGMLSALR